MKKILVVFAIFAALIFVVSCGGGSKNDDQTNTGDTNPTTEGIYLGIIGFNESQTIKDIALLDKSTVNNYESFIDYLTSGDGTGLYFADYTALKKMRNYPIPPKLKNVALVTFTDGLDNISLNDEYNPENYGSTDAYQEAIHKKIVSEKIHEHSVEAYTIGLKGKDVTDDAKFEKTLKGLASSDSNVFQVSDMNEVKESFAAIAKALYSVSKTEKLDIKVPGGYDDGQLLRFTFDNPDAATDSELYIEATFRRSNGRTLEEITYKGFAKGQKTISSDDKDGAYYHFVFENLKYTNGDPLSDSDIRKIMLWKQTSSGGWDKESEFDRENSVDITEDKNSALIMLVLDCTTSLGSDFARMQQAGKDFIKTLVNGNNSNSNGNNGGGTADNNGNSDDPDTGNSNSPDNGDSDNTDTGNSNSPDNGDSDNTDTGNSNNPDNGDSDNPDSGDPNYTAAEECYAVGGIWDNEKNSCTRTKNCTELPFAAEWNAVSSIKQTWNGSEWVPSNESTFNLTQSSKECRFKCKENYTWNETQAECIADTQTSSCINLPAGAKWNQYDEVIQTWDGSSWQPDKTGVYNENPSKTQCRYVCDTHATWNGSECACNNGYFSDGSTCMNPCEYEPCSGVENTATGTASDCAATAWNEYSCKCSKDGIYTWNGVGCVEVECDTTQITPCKDSETGLVWSARSSDVVSGSNYCSTLTEGGFTDWRLPNIDELRTLSNCSNTKLGGACQVSAKTGCLSSSCRDSTCNSCGTLNASTISKFGEVSLLNSSSKVSSYSDTYYWSIDFSSGAITTAKYYSTTRMQIVRCVRNAD